MGKMLKMQMLEDEDDLAYETEKKERTSSTSDAQPAWMRTLHTTACNWLQLMPQMVNPLKRTVENIKVKAHLKINKYKRRKSGWHAVTDLQSFFPLDALDSVDDHASPFLLLLFIQLLLH